MSPTTASRLPWIFGALLVALLGLLAVLQLRWLDEVGDAERQRLEAGVETALGSLTDEIDREVSRALMIFRPAGPFEDPEAVAAVQHQRWNELSPVPELVRSVEIVLLPAGARPFPELLPELPGLRVPVSPRRPERHARHGRSERHRGEPTEAVLVTFDREHLADELLPALVRRHLEPVLGDDADVRVTVADGGELLFSSTASPVHPDHPAAGGGRYEWRMRAFGLLPPDELTRLAFVTGAEANGLDPPDDPAGEGVSDERGDRSRRDLSRRARRLGAFASLLDVPPGWTVEVRPAAGSLDAALARARRGNATLVFGILLLLVAAAVALALSARRAQEMARRQMEFTAAVSHELRTPLAAIRSLADNLADGVVAEPEQSRRYGAEIARQGERLTSMVEQVLALATEEGTRRVREPEPVEVAALVRSAAREAAAAAPGAELEIDVPDDLPPVLGERAVLERAVANLVGNALKHGATGRGQAPWVGVKAVSSRSTSGAPEVTIEVADRGPGIPPSERERLFEPFFRGAGARAGQLPGSGLGLHLVRRIAAAHGGRVTVESAPGEGSRFALHLPAAAPVGEGRRAESPTGGEVAT